MSTEATSGPQEPPSAPAAEQDPLAAVERWRERGRRAALATVLRTWGSSPRQPGSQLAVSEAREFVGSVSGGCVEGAVIEEAQDVMASGKPTTLEFGVSDEDAWAVGLACGGKVSIYVEPAPEEELLAAVRRARDEGGALVVATRLADGARWLLRPLEEGDGGVSSGLSAAAAAAVRSDRSGVAAVPEGEVFLKVHNPPLRMVLVGAVHIAQALAPMAALAGFEVVVVDPRRAFAAADRFPGVRLRQGWPDEVLPGLALDHRTAVVTLSHDPKLDDPALDAALGSPALYVGALGSRRTHGKRVERLRARGWSAEDVGRIHAPVGLDIGAVSPGEIAVAVLAQVVERVRRGVGEPLPS